MRLLSSDFIMGLYALKRTLRADVGDFEKDFLFEAAMEGAREFFSSHGCDKTGSSPREAFDLMLKLLRDMGFGDFRVAEFDEAKGVAEVRCSNAPEALAFQSNRDSQTKPVCAYSAGILSWIGRLAFDGPRAADSEIMASESQCMAQGNSECRFVIGSSDYLRKTCPAFISRGTSSSEHDLRLNEEILSKNLELQALNLTLERQIRRKTEEVWRFEENYRSLMDLVPDPVAIMLPNGRIIVANPTGAGLFGIDLERETSEANIISMLTDKAVWDKIIWLLEKEGNVTDFEFDLVRTDGKRLNLRMSAKFADLIPGRCVEAVFQDVTDRKLMEQQVIEAKSESEFFNDLLSHDIMNYTFSALHFLDTVWKSKALTEEDRRYLAMVTKDLQGAFELSTSVRDLARLKTIQEEELVIRDLKLLILEAVEDTRRLFSDRKTRINFERDTEQRYVKCSALANRIFTNLLTNAIKFNPAQEAAVDITVKAVNENGTAYWQVTITDYGKGIQDEEKEKVFERFHRLDQAVKGTGLGLYVARTIVQASGGRIWAENRIKGDYTKGTRMAVLLRKADEKEVAMQSKRPLADAH
ncbi:MAG: PAS domain S-box protein [Candidatus Thermoplasmatota archaeon]|nr:PAS domain S-box protein [Candidatus Thermoplasmatota archaeon]